MIGYVRTHRALTCAAILMAATLLAGFGHIPIPILREIAAFLIVEDSLQPAAAIVSLAGQTPFRELEAAKLYHAGWAPTVVIVREAPSAELGALEKLGIKKPEPWELSRAVLIQQGVPPAAIAMPEGEGLGTLEELTAAYAGLGINGAPVIFVTSKYHTRRTAAYLAVRNRRSFTAHRPRSKPGPLRSRSLVAAAQLRLICRTRIPRLGQLLCGVPHRALGRDREALGVRGKARGRGYPLRIEVFKTSPRSRLG
jgi:uncharacterized SAM-binding protein YcdF (DUF218 family)